MSEQTDQVDTEETEATDETVETGTGVEADAAPRPSRQDRLENEGDIAADYLEELLDIADLDGDLDMDVDGDRASVSIVGADLSQLVGRNGEVLDALAGKRPDLHVVVTGRNAKPELIEAADLVTEMRLVKHPFREGIKGQLGVEY